MFTVTLRSITFFACCTLMAGSVNAADFTWQGGGSVSIIDAANWVGGVVPPNDGTNINLTAVDRILFTSGGKTIPNDSNRQINVPAGAQILTNNAGDKIIDARVNMAGAGPDTNGALFINTGGWGKPQNLFLTGATTVTANGARFRIDGGPNRLDLAGNTLTVQGDGETNLVNTNVYNTSGTIISNHVFSVEGSTRIDPAVTVDMAPNTLHTSWDGNNHRREHATILRNNAVIETRKVDRDLTFTGPITVNAGDTGILRPQVQNVTQPGDGTDQRLNIMSAVSGPGAIRQDGNATLMLSGNNTHTGGTTLAPGLYTPPAPGVPIAVSSTLAASNTAFGTGAVTVENASTVNLSNAGGAESRDSLLAGDPVGASTIINPALTGLHSTQAYDQTRWSYTGKINNTSAASVVYTFIEQYDDDVFLQVDGVTLLNDGAFGTPTTGQASLTPGEHDIRVSVRNGGGGAGPNGGFQDVGFAYGVGVSTALPLGGATINRADYTGLGSSLQVYQNTNRTFSNPFVLNAPLTLTTSEMNGFTATVSGAISGPSDLVVGGSAAFGTDRLILSGTNTYAGNTTVAAGGNLQMTGAHTNAANYVVDAGGVLFVNGALNVTDSAAPTAPADLSITNSGAASFGTSASLNLDLFSDMPGAGGAASENDELIVGGPITLTLAGALNVGNPNSISTFSLGDAWDLFDWNTAPTATFNSVNLPALPVGLTWNSSDIYTGGTISVVPEPSSAALLSIFAATTLLRRRRN